MREPSGILLERYLLDELPPADKAALMRQLAVDPALRARLERLRAANEGFGRSRDAGAFVRSLRERMRRDAVHAGIRMQPAREPRAGDARPARPVRNRPRFAGWQPALGGVFLVALVAVPAWRVLNGGSTVVAPGVSAEAPGATRPLAAEGLDRARADAPTAAADVQAATAADATTPPNTPEGPRQQPARVRTEASPPPTPAERLAEGNHTTASVHGETTRLKGLQPTLALFRRTPGGAEPLRPGAAVKPGDVLRIGYRAAGRSFGAIFSVDGHGNVTRHWPLTGDRAARLAGGETLLPGAFELDDAPAYERFYLLVSEHEFDLKPLLASLHAARSLTEDNIEVIRFDLLKENGI